MMMMTACGYDNDIQKMQDTKLCRWLAQALCCLRRLTTLLTIGDRKVMLLKIAHMKETPPLFSFPSCQLFVKSARASSLKNTVDDDDDADACVEESGELILSRFEKMMLRCILFCKAFKLSLKCC